MTDSIIYQDPKTKVTLVKDEVTFVQQVSERNPALRDIVVVSRAAMNEIVRGYEREKEQEDAVRALGTPTACMSEPRRSRDTDAFGFTGPKKAKP